MIELFDRVGVRATWHAREIGTGHGAGYREHEPVTLASVSKVALTTAVYRLADQGRLDLSRVIDLHPDGRSVGTTGVSAMQDRVSISLRDSAYLALTISDNAAADALWDAAGSTAITTELNTLGLAAIKLRQPMRDLYDAALAQGADSEAGLTRTDWACLDPNRASSATPYALTGLLELLWTDRAASAPACAQIREYLARQIWHQRLATGFPAVDIQVAGKTGTFLTLRHEIGVISYPDGAQYAVAIMTESRTGIPDHRADAAIGEAARRIVTALRRR